MPSLTIVTRDGSRHQVEGEAGLSVMEVIREAGFDEILALCGGCCSCATCHVYVDPAYGDRVNPMEACEDDLLDMADARTPQSRLSCQIKFGDALDGLTVTIAPDE